MSPTVLIMLYSCQYLDFYAFAITPLAVNVAMAMDVRGWKVQEIYLTKTKNTLSGTRAIISWAISCPVH